MINDFFQFLVQCLILSVGIGFPSGAELLGPICQCLVCRTVPDFLQLVALLGSPPLLRVLSLWVYISRCFTQQFVKKLFIYVLHSIP